MSRPASKFVNSLSEADRQFLEKAWRQHSTYTVRYRAHAVLLSSQGFSVAQLQRIFDISKPTHGLGLDRPLGAKGTRGSGR